jgi:hypothetical protein
MQYYGMTPADTIRTLVGAHKMLLEKPAEGVRYIMKQYGVSMEEAMKPDAAPKEPSKEEQRIQELERREYERQQYMAQQQAQGVGNAIQQYFADNPDNTPAVDEMTKRAVAYRAAGQNPPPLDKLFEEVKWNVPEIREKLLQSEGRTDRSKAAASVNVQREADAPGTAKSESVRESTRDTLAEEWANLERSGL